MRTGNSSVWRIIIPDELIKKSVSCIILELVHVNVVIAELSRMRLKFLRRRGWRSSSAWCVCSIRSVGR